MVRESSALRQPEWHHLRPIGNSIVVRLSALFPVAGYLVMLNAQAFEYLNLDPQLQFIPGFNQWRLVLLYYGLALAALGSILYAVGCPPLVKKFSTPTEYVSAEAVFYTSRLRAEIKAQSLRKLLALASPAQRRHVYISHHLAKFEAEPEDACDRDFLLAGMALEWFVATTSRPLRRIGCCVLYSAGFAILAIPTIVTLLEVTAWIVTSNRTLSN